MRLRGHGARSLPRQPALHFVTSPGTAIPLGANRGKLRPYVPLWARTLDTSLRRLRQRRRLRASEPIEMHHQGGSREELVYCPHRADELAVRQIATQSPGSRGGRVAVNAGLTVEQQFLPSTHTQEPALDSPLADPAGTPPCARGQDSTRACVHCKERRRGLPEAPQARHPPSDHNCSTPRVRPLYLTIDPQMARISSDLAPRNVRAPLSQRAPTPIESARALDRMKTLW